MTSVYQIVDGILSIIMIDNQAKLNALTSEMLQVMEEILLASEHDDEVLCVIVAAKGDRAFCSGADINEWSEQSPAEFARYWIRYGHQVFDRLARMAKPTIAAINGDAFGGGLELAAACDIRVMAPNAKLALPEAGIGVVPGWSGTQRLARVLPESVVKEMALFGRRISAKRALRLGFVAEVSNKPLDRARSIAKKAAMLSPRAVEACKQMIHAGANEDRSAMIDSLASAAIAASDDLAEGVAAFRGKRTPKFTGI